MGGVCAFIDAEHALDVQLRPQAGRQDRRAAGLPARLRRAGPGDRRHAGALQRGDVIVVDSVAALVPRAELEGEMGDTHMGLQARLMSQALRKLTGTISKSDTLVIFINQIRMKIGVMFGSPETTTGGNALKFYCLGAPGHPPHRRDQGGRRGDRQPHPGQGGQEQAGAALPRGRVRHHVRRGHQLRGRPARPGGRPQASWTRAAPGTPSAASGSARAARTPSSSSRRTPSWRRRCVTSWSRRWGSPGRTSPRSRKRPAWQRRQVHPR